ncbi:hypothetical protein BH11PLA2_BH11PLA2_34020 [soil metagenome]
MSYTVPISSLIDYPPSAMDSFPVYAFEWIDNLHFILPPERFIPDPTAYIEAARIAFQKAGWEGEGDIGIMWLPPFVFPLRLQATWLGVMLWHVKQIVLVYRSFVKRRS